MNAQWKAWLDQLRGLPHGQVGVALGELLMLSEVIAGALAAEDAAAFRAEVPAAVKARLDRFQVAGQRPGMRERWVEPDLLPTLDLLARWMSRARGTDAEGHLARILFDDLDAACASEGWFGIDRIELGVTRFDPKRHRAVERTEGPEDTVVAVLRPGRTDPAEGWCRDLAEVAVGGDPS